MLPTLSAAHWSNLMTKQIIYKEIIEIDGHEYKIAEFDYSEFVNDAINQDFISDDNQEIINWVVSDITEI
jgi:hypothetical protein